MKSSLRLLAAVGLLALASAPVHAQPPGGGNMQERQAQMRAALFEGITLTDAQKLKIDTIYAEGAKKRQELMQGERGPEMMQKMQAMQQEQNEAIKKVLTAEQVPVFEKNLANMPQRRRGGGA